jgi:hypothetical protein
MSRDDTFSPLAGDEFQIPIETPREALSDPETRRRRNEARIVEMLRKEHEAYAHCHEILAVASVDAEAQTVQVTLYDWTCRREADKSTSSPSVTFSVREPESVLTTVKGFFNLDTLRLPPDSTASVAELLADEEQDDEYDFCDDDAGSDAGSVPPPSSKAPPLHELVRKLRQRLSSQKIATRGRLVQLWSFPVQSTAAENVFGDRTKKYLWHWYKPTSPYQKKGAWETQLDTVLDNGSWMAGKDLILVVRRVPEEV